MNDVAELQNLSTHSRRKWMFRGDEVNKFGVVVAGGEWFFASLPKLLLPLEDYIYISIVVFEEHSIKEIIEEQPK